MPRFVRTGRTPHETRELPPDRLDCGHPIGPRLVTIGTGDRDGKRLRIYRCNACGTVTYVP